MGYEDILNDSIEKEDYDSHKDGCFKMVTQNAEVSVPVEIEPKTEIGKIEVECCGDPRVSCECKPSKCNPEESKIKVKIKQKVRIKIPVKFKFTGCAGESKIDCEPDRPCPDKPCFKNY